MTTQFFNIYLFMVAIRQLLNRKRQAFLIISGIGVGVMVLVTALSLMDGILQSFIDKIINNSPHIVLSGEKINPPVPDMLIEPESSRMHIRFIKNTERQDEEVIKNYTKVEDVLRGEKLISTISPVVFVNTIGIFGTLSLPVALFGVVPAEANKIQRFSENMIAGRFEDVERTPDGIMVGISLARDLTVQVGDRIQFVGTSGDRFPVRITGVFSTGINDVDNSAYANLPLAQTIGGLAPDEVTQLYLRVTDLQQNAAIALRVAGRTNHKATTWEQNAAGFIGLFRMITTIVYFLVFFVIVVAGFGVANILITNVLEKYRDIAIMKSVGFRKNEITYMYMLQGIMVAFIGAAIGCLLGFIMIEILSSIPITPSQTGTLRSDRLAMGRSPVYFAVASLFSFVVCIAASIGPSRRAAKVNPVEILRGER